MKASIRFEKNKNEINFLLSFNHFGMLLLSKSTAQAEEII